jgi:diguanylate cyclase (GGDEF)-like protein
MEQFIRLDVNLFAVVILIILSVNSKKGLNPGNEMGILFKKLTLWTLAATVIETLSFVVDMRSGSTMVVLNYISNTLLFILAPIIMYLWVEYVECFFIKDENDIKARRKYRSPLVAMLVILAGVNLFSGVLFHIGEDNLYQRGTWYFVQVALNFAIVFQAYETLYRYRRQLEPTMVVSLALFPVLPILGALIQSSFYGTTTILSYMVVALLLIFLNVQRTLIFRDPLTGLDNRRSIDLMVENMRDHRQGILYAGMMLDIDNLKEVNDVYGHGAGDLAIKRAAEIIRGSVRKSDFVARYAGDEFLVIMEVQDRIALQSAVERIRRAFDHYNLSSKEAWTLNVSIGYDTINHESPESVEMALSRIDGLMYQEKKKRKWGQCLAAGSIT